MSGEAPQQLPRPMVEGSIGAQGVGIPASFNQEPQGQPAPQMGPHPVQDEYAYFDEAFKLRSQEIEAKHRGASREEIDRIIGDQWGLMSMQQYQAEQFGIDAQNFWQGTDLLNPGLVEDRWVMLQGEKLALSRIKLANPVIAEKVNNLEASWKSLFGRFEQARSVNMQALNATKDPEERQRLAGMIYPLVKDEEYHQWAADISEVDKALKETNSGLSVYNHPETRAWARGLTATIDSGGPDAIIRKEAPDPILGAISQVGAAGADALVKSTIGMGSKALRFTMQLGADAAAWATGRPRLEVPELLTAFNYTLDENGKPVYAGGTFGLPEMAASFMSTYMDEQSAMYMAATSRAELDRLHGFRDGDLQGILNGTGTIVGSLLGAQATMFGPSAKVAAGVEGMAARGIAYLRSGTKTAQALKKSLGLIAGGATMGLEMGAATGRYEEFGEAAKTGLLMYPAIAIAGAYGDKLEAALLGGEMRGVLWNNGARAIRGMFEGLGIGAMGAATGVTLDPMFSPNSEEGKILQRFLKDPNTENTKAFYGYMTEWAVANMMTSMMFGRAQSKEAIAKSKIREKLRDPANWADEQLYQRSQKAFEQEFHKKFGPEIQRAEAQPIDRRVLAAIERAGIIDPETLSGYAPLVKKDVMQGLSALAQIFRREGEIVTKAEKAGHIYEPLRRVLEAGGGELSVDGGQVFIKMDENLMNRIVRHTMRSATRQGLPQTGKGAKPTKLGDTELMVAVGEGPLNEWFMSAVKGAEGKVPSDQLLKMMKKLQEKVSARHVQTGGAPTRVAGQSIATMHTHPNAAGFSAADFGYFGTWHWLNLIGQSGRISNKGVAPQMAIGTSGGFVLRPGPGYKGIPSDVNDRMHAHDHAAATILINKIWDGDPSVPANWTTYARTRFKTKEQLMNAQIAAQYSGPVARMGDLPMQSITREVHHQGTIELAKELGIDYAFFTPPTLARKWDEYIKQGWFDMADGENHLAALSDIQPRIDQGAAKMRPPITPTEQQAPPEDLEGPIVQPPPEPTQGDIDRGLSEAGRIEKGMEPEHVPGKEPQPIEPIVDKEAEAKKAERRLRESTDPLEDPRFLDLPETVRQEILAAKDAQARKEIFARHAQERRTEGGLRSLETPIPPPAPQGGPTTEEGVAALRRGFDQQATYWESTNAFTRAARAIGRSTVEFFQRYFVDPEYRRQLAHRIRNTVGYGAKFLTLGVDEDFVKARADQLRATVANADKQVRIQRSHVFEPIIRSENLTKGQRQQQIDEVLQYAVLLDLETNQFRTVREQTGTQADPVTGREVPVYTERQVEREMPFGVSVESVRELRAEIAERMTPEQMESFGRIRTALDEAWGSMVARGLVRADDAIENYFPHQIMDWSQSDHPAIGTSLPKQRPNRSYLNRREGSRRMFDTSIRALQDYLMRVHVNNAKHDFLESTASMSHNRILQETGHEGTDWGSLSPDEWRGIREQMDEDGYVLLDTRYGRTGQQTLDRDPIVQRLLSDIFNETGIPMTPEVVVGARMRPNEERGIYFVTKEFAEFLRNGQTPSRFSQIPGLRIANQLIGRWIKGPMLRGFLGTASFARAARNMVSDLHGIWMKSGHGASDVLATLRNIPAAKRVIEAFRLRDTDPNYAQNLSDYELSILEEMESRGTLQVNVRGQEFIRDDAIETEWLNRVMPETGSSIGRMLSKMYRGDFKWAKKLDDYSENLLRVGYFMRERMERFRTLEGAADRNDLSADYAHLRTGEVLVNYNHLTPLERHALNGIVFPFYTWAKGNFFGILAAGAERPIGTLGRAAIAAAPFVVWNAFMAKDEEERLWNKNPWLAAKPHLILPHVRDSFGNPMVLSFDSTMGEALSFLGMDQLDSDAFQFLAGHQDKAILAKDLVPGVFENMRKQWSSFVAPWMRAIGAQVFSSQFVTPGERAEQFLEQDLPQVSRPWSDLQSALELGHQERSPESRWVRLAPFVGFVDLFEGINSETLPQHYLAGRIQRRESQLSARIGDNMQRFTIGLKTQNVDMMRAAVARVWDDMGPELAEAGIEPSHLVSRFVDRAVRQLKGEQLQKSGISPKWLQLSRSQKAELVLQLLRRRGR